MQFELLDITEAYNGNTRAFDSSQGVVFSWENQGTPVAGTVKRGVPE